MAASVPTPTKPDWAQNLTNKQRCFVEEYLVDLNGTQAAIRAGYAKSGAAVEAHRQLRNAKIAAAINEALAERTGITRMRIVDELAAVAFTHIGELLTWDELGIVKLKAIEDMSERARRAIQAFKFKNGKIEGISMQAKLAALDKLGKLIGAQKDTLEVTGVIKMEDRTYREIARRIAFALARGDMDNQDQGLDTGSR